MKLSNSSSSAVFPADAAATNPRTILPFLVIDPTLFGFSSVYNEVDLQKLFY